MDGGALVSDVLSSLGVKFLFTLCGGHISPILVGAKRRGIRVLDVRDEASAVFAADAISRLTGLPGVAAVTAGPGVTNAITALKNAQLAQSPLVLLGGATATLLCGRGALQDIDQMALVRPHVKWLGRATSLGEISPLLRHAFHEARSGVPGPVFLELPVDILYPEEVVRRFYGVTASEKQRSVFERLRRAHIERHLKRLFSSTAAKKLRGLLTSGPASIHVIDDRMARRAALLLGKAHRPVLLIGSQALLSPDDAAGLVRAVELLGLPVYLSGMARGLLGPDHPLQARHRRKEALREADLVLLAGVPCDFRLEYGRHISRKAKVIAVNRHAADLRKNRQPHLGAHGDPAHFLQGLAPIFSESMASRGGGASGPGEARWQWLETLRRRDRERDEEIKKLARLPAPPINPLRLCEAIDQALAESSIVVADGGDFVATASYIVRPRRPLSWLDPGVFGTLGVGAGFALGAKLCHPEAEVWLLYGDGSAAYSLAEVDTFVRHGMGLIAVVGNDAAWMQIARDQKAVLGDDVGTVLRRSDYHAVAEGWGGRGLLLDDEGRIDEILREAKEIARSGVPVVVNAHLGMTEFRKGSISL